MESLERTPPNPVAANIMKTGMSMIENYIMPNLKESNWG